MEERGVRGRAKREERLHSQEAIERKSFKQSS